MCFFTKIIGESSFLKDPQRREQKSLKFGAIQKPATKNTYLYLDITSKNFCCKELFS